MFRQERHSSTPSPGALAFHIGGDHPSSLSNRQADRLRDLLADFEADHRGVD
jgi:hypothetical protein